MKEGEIVNYDFEVYADDRLIDTSIEELAKEQGIFSEEKHYGSNYIIVGTDGPYPGIKDALEKAEEGGEAEVVLDPESGFGRRNPGLVKYFRYSDVAYWAQRQEKTVERGETIEINGRKGTINLVTPGRVRVDFNPPYAGKKLRVKVRVNGVVQEKDEILRVILKMNVGTSEGFEFSEENGVLTIKIPSGIGLTEDWLNAKIRVVSQIRRYAGIKNIRYIEEFFQKTPLSEATAKAEEAAPEEEEKETPAPEEPAVTGTAEKVTQEPSESEAGSDVAVMEKEEE